MCFLFADDNSRRAAASSATSFSRLTFPKIDPGAIGGGSDSYTFQAKSKTWDAKFARWTKWVALVFVLLTFVLVLL